jgi:hypothetical protein
VLHWGSTNNVGFSKAMAPPLQVSKHFRFKLFFNVEPNLSIQSMAHVGSNSYQGVFSNILESISIGIEACPCLHTNPENNRNFGMESSNSFVPPAKKKPKRFYEKTRVFQHTWACHFPWAKPIIGDNGLVSQVRCTIYNKIFKKPKLLALNFDMLQKHAGCRKAIVPSLGVVVGD